MAAPIAAVELSKLACRKLAVGSLKFPACKHRGPALMQGVCACTGELVLGMGAWATLKEGKTTARREGEVKIKAA